MTNLKRSIAQIPLYVATTDPEAVAKVKQILDAAMAALRRQNARNAAANAARDLGIDNFLGGLFGGKGSR